MPYQEAGGRHHIHALWQVGEAISAGLLGVKNQAAVDTIDLTPHEWGQQLGDNNWFLCRGRSCAGPKTMTKPINDPTDLNLSNIFLGPAQDRPLQCHRGQSIPITGGNL